ncbi:MAG: high-potential iron-sulfur protein [Candidatus Thiosymbion ectosymbiont of Robbea hypermnestra]|nr:high-potential iron-sulfur protein [Candidatus Thiosymbion ectosymbiont of Robbea hypermnestra]
MSDKPVNESRRGALKAMVGGLAAAPLMNLVGLTAAQAGDSPEKITADDPRAKVVKYNPDATKSVRDAEAMNQVCGNCMLYVAREEEDGEWGTCAAVGNQLVSTKGWCVAWSLKQQPNV